ncbi:MAG: SDR family NAD(P)-dependent oxidoreductase, partial [Fimbriimonadaceae bacterium]|nr:SDR family NAD(P)-dependent oxidoreductase [Fimbriimonadaceae bacterium]
MPALVSGTALILGAGSPLAREMAALLAQRGLSLILAGRDAEDLQRIAADLAIRFAVKVSVEPFDALDVEDHEEFWLRLKAENPDLNGVVCAFGLMLDQKAMEERPIMAQQVLAANFNGAVSILLHAANDLERQSHGWIVGIS